MIALPEGSGAAVPDPAASFVFLTLSASSSFDLPSSTSAQS